MRREYIIAAIAAAVLIVVAVAFFVIKPHFGGASVSETASANDPAALVQTNRVVARVNGTDIRLFDVVMMEEDMGPALAQAQIPPQMRPAYLLEALISRRIVALEAKKAGTTDSDQQVKLREAYFDEQAVRDVFWLRSLRKRLSDDALKAYYTANYVNQKEAHAAHILVATKEEAQKVIDDLKAGKKFEDLARERSKDPSGKQSGGVLDWYKKVDFVPEIGNVIFSMNPGETSAEPVQSRFGWHVIRLLEYRDGATPTLDEVRPIITRTLTGREGSALLKAWRQQAKVELIDEKGKAQALPPPGSAAVAPAAAAPEAQTPPADAAPEAAPEEAPATAPAEEQPAQ
jgi:peptidyl-prolyl cis-trans isomerase C